MNRNLGRFIRAAALIAGVSLTANQANAQTTLKGSPNSGVGSGAIAGGQFDTRDVLSDTIIGAPSVVGGGDAYVVFGRPDMPPEIDLGTIGDDGLVFSSEHVSGDFGRAAIAADMNCDFRDDLVVGDPANDEVHVLYGPLPTGRANARSLDGTIGTTFKGKPGTRFGSSLAAGRISFRGGCATDLLIGAPGANRNGDLAGAGHVVLSQEQFPAEVDLAYPGSVVTFAIHGNPGDQVGSAVALGQFRSGGIDDIILGAPTADTGMLQDTGAVYVVFSNTDLPDGDLYVANLNGTAGFRAAGINAGDNVGTSVYMARLTPDLFSDVVAVAPGANVGGELYLLFGSNAIIPGGETSFSDLGPNTGAVVYGFADAGMTQAIVTTNLLGDGDPTIVTGIPFAGGIVPGAGGVLALHGADLSKPLDLNEPMNPDTYGIILGEYQAGSEGMRVGSIGDINGDGLEEIAANVPNRQEVNVTYGRVVPHVQDLVAPNHQ